MLCNFLNYYEKNIEDYYCYCVVYFTDYVSLSLHSTYDALARNAIRDADMMPNIILTVFILFGFVFNLSKILPSQYYIKSIHKFLRITDLIILPLTCIYFASGLIQLFKNVSSKDFQLKDLSFLLIITGIICYCICLIKDNLHYQKEIKEREENSKQKLLDEIGT